MTDAEHSGAAFEGLVRPEIGKLYRLAYRLTGNVKDAEDLVQDVLIKAFQRRRELSSIEGLGAWLARVMYNQFIDDIRRHQRRRFSVVSVDDKPLESGLESALVASDPEPSEAHARGALRAALAQALGTLSVEHRTVVLMHDAEGYTLEEIQRITGVALGTLKSRLHRARARLRTLLEDGTFSPGNTLNQ